MLLCHEDVGEYCVIGGGILCGFFCLSGVHCVFLIQYSIAWEKNSITKPNMFFICRAVGTVTFSDSCHSLVVLCSRFTYINIINLWGFPASQLP